jgi:hypothetical protein
MTRAALITLRNAGGLSKDCDYVITDHVQGRLVAGTTIHLQAVNANTLAENVSVKTTYDNEAWHGLYNIDSGIVFYLADNFGNTVRGTQDVTTFDWGNPNYQRNTINGCFITYTYGNTATVQYLNATNASIDLTGYAGNISHLDVTGSTITLTGSSVRFFRCNFSYGTNANFTGTTDTGVLSRWSINASTLNFSGSTTNFTSLVNVRAHVASWSMTNVIGGVLSGSGLDISNSTLNFTDGIGTFTVSNNSTIESGSVINFSAGNLTINRTTVASGSTIQVGGDNTSTTFFSSHIKTFDLVNNGAGNLQFLSADVSSGTALNVAAGSSCALTFRNTKLSDSSDITIAATAIGNAITFNNCTIGANQSVSVTGTRSLTASDCVMNSSTLTLSGSGAVTDTLSDSTMNSDANITLSNSGAANSIATMTILGEFSTFSVSGTSGSGTYNRMALLYGRYNETNVPTAKSIVVARIENTGTINMLDAPAGYQLVNVTVGQNAVLNINKTGIGDSRYINIIRGTLNITGTAGTVDDVLIETGGTGIVNINGGTVSGLSKKMSSTLTINGGTQSNIHHWTTVSKTTSANNTNAVDYLGVVSSVPIV